MLRRQGEQCKQPASGCGVWSTFFFFSRATDPAASQAPTCKSDLVATPSAHHEIWWGQMVWGEEVCEGIDEQGNGALSLLIIQELGPFPLVLPKRKETPRLGSEITNLDH